MADVWTAEVWVATTNSFIFRPPAETPTGYFDGGRNWPAPDTEPFSPAIRSNAQFLRTIDGGTTLVNSDIKFTESPLTFVWSKVSGSQLRLHLENAVRLEVGYRISPHTGTPISGVWVEVNPRVRPGYQDGHDTHYTVYDIKATFQPMNLSSGT